MEKIISIHNSDIFNLYPGKCYHLANGYRFSFDTSGFESNLEFGLVVCDKKSGEIITKIPFEDNMRFGRVYSCISPDFDAERYSYLYYAGKQLVMDERAEKFCFVSKDFGKFEQNLPPRAAFTKTIEWDGDVKPNVSFEDSFIYLIHVRGFTKHTSSGTKYKGTFKGIEEKIDYLKGLGVTALELQPAYEFDECDKETGKVNYWGYTKSFYYAPKAAYCFGNDPEVEFSHLIKELHCNGLEIILQFYFPKDYSRSEIVTVLEYWAQKYHVDGFHVFGESIPMDLINKSALLSELKIFADCLDGVNLGISNSRISKCERKYALDRDDYLYSLRKFLKGDENTLQDALYRMKLNPTDYGIVNYFDNYNSLTLSDMVSYDLKHNELNGENNTDGNDFNCSWNCGEEGPSRKQKVNRLRRKQLENALLLLFLSCGIPRLVMGDEFGHSQQGNNNPYCQDNEITWLDWKGLNKKISLYEFISDLMKLRREKAFLHKATELSLVDVSGCGFPEISYHGESAWKTQVEGYRHSVGILYSEGNDLLYAAINMYWDVDKLSLPRPPKGYEWKLYLTTDSEVKIEEPLKIKIPERTIAIYVTEKKI